MTILEEIERRFSCGSWDHLDVSTLLNLSRLAFDTSALAAPVCAEINRYREARQQIEERIRQYEKERRKP